MRHMCPNADEELAQWWGQRCRAATSPGAARALIEMNSLVDVRDTLHAVQAPTLVLHRRHDVDSHVEEGRYLADHIPGAQFVELDGADHFVAVDPDQILDPVEEFVRSLESSHLPSRRSPPCWPSTSRNRSIPFGCAASSNRWWRAIAASPPW